MTHTSPCWWRNHTNRNKNKNILRHQTSLLCEGFCFYHDIQWTIWGRFHYSLWGLIDNYFFSNFLHSLLSYYYSKNSITHPLNTSEIPQNNYSLRYKLISHKTLMNIPIMACIRLISSIQKFLAKVCTIATTSSFRNVKIESHPVLILFIIHPSIFECIFHTTFSIYDQIFIIKIVTVRYLESFLFLCFGTNLLWRLYSRGQKYIYPIKCLKAWYFIYYEYFNNEN